MFNVSALLLDDALLLLLF